MGTINSAHDKFVKETFSDVEVTSDFMQNYLPTEVLDIIELSTLKPLKDSFINPDLEEAFSDLLFGVNMNGIPGYIYLLFEHKSQQTKDISLQLLRYMLEIWHRKMYKEKTDKLPLIIPLVIYHGQNQWGIKPISDFIEGYRDFSTTIQEYVPAYNYLLFDLSQFSEKEIKGTVKLKVCLDILKHIYNQNEQEFEIVFKKSVQELLELQREHQDIVIYIKTFIKYVLNVREKFTTEKAHDIANKISSQGGSIVATAADELRREGREEGREKEREEVAKNLLRLNIDVAQIIKATKLSAEKLNQIKKSL